MIKIVFPLLCSLFSVGYADPVCHRCEEIREYNRTHKETDFIYYEDYLKDKEEKGKQNEPQKPASEEQK